MRAPLAAFVVVVALSCVDARLLDARALQQELAQYSPSLPTSHNITTVRKDGRRLSSRARRVLLSRLVTLVLSAKTGGKEAMRRARIASSMYASEEYRSLVWRVIVVWHGSKEGLPAPTERVVWIAVDPAQATHARWTLPLPYIETEFVLALDDDVLWFKPAIQCLLVAPDRRVQPRLISGPYVKNLDAQSLTWTKDSDDDDEYAIILPRAILVKRALFTLYGRDAGKRLLQYTQDHDPLGTADEIVLAYVARDSKVRVLPPPATVFDYAAECGPVPDVRAPDLGGLDADFWATSMLRVVAQEPTLSGFDVHANNTATCEIRQVGNETGLLVRPVRSNETSDLLRRMSAGQRWRDQLCPSSSSSSPPPPLEV